MSILKLHDSAHTHYGYNCTGMAWATCFCQTWFLSTGSEETARAYL